MNIEHSLYKTETSPHPVSPFIQPCLPNHAEELVADLQMILNETNLEMQENLIQAFIDRRLIELEKESTSPDDTLFIGTQKAENQFIHPKTEIKRNLLYAAFNVNDNIIYSFLFQNLIKIYKHWNKPPLKNIIETSIIYALGEYFGNHFGASNTDQRNQQLYIAESSTNNSIDLYKFKGKALAVCAEKAAVTHNYLKFLGLESYLIFSTSCNLGNGASAHAYVIYIKDNKYIIFDPTNPVGISNNQEEIAFVTPAVYPISRENFMHLLNRDRVTVPVNHYNKIFDGTEYINEAVTIRVYG